MTMRAQPVPRPGAGARRGGQHGQPETGLRAESTVVLGLAPGVLTVEQAISAGDLHGDRQDRATALGSDGVRPIP